MLWRERSVNGASELNSNRDTPNLTTDSIGQAAETLLTPLSPEKGIRASQRGDVGSSAAGDSRISRHYSGWEIFVESSNTGREQTGRAYALQCTPEVISILENDTEVHAGMLNEVSAFITAEIESGIASFAGLLMPGEYFVWIRSPGFITRGEFLTFPLPTESAHWELVQTAPLTVEVTNENGLPIPAKTVWVENTSASTEYPSFPWRHKLASKYYSVTSRTDDRGLAVIKDPLSTHMDVFVGSGNGYSMAQVHSAQAGSHVQLVLQPTFTVSGHVEFADQDEVPDHAFVYFWARGEETRSLGIGSASVDESGFFVAEDVAAGHDCVLVMAATDGYSVPTKTILRPKAGAKYSVDFVVHKAQEFDLRLVTAAGEGVPEVPVSFSIGAHDFVPFSYRTDEFGRFRTRPTMLPGNQYLLHWTVGEHSPAPIPVKMPARPPFSMDVELPPLGRWSRANIWHKNERVEDYNIIFFGLGDRGGPRAAWSSAEHSPWILAGPAVVVVEFPSGLSVEREVYVREGENGALVLRTQSVPVSFRLPKPPTSELWEVELRPARSSKSTTSRLGSGNHTVQVIPGELYLHIQDSSGTSSSWGPFVVGALGLDLGSLSPGYCSISGTVADELDEPWSGMEVFLHRDHGAAVGTATTGDSGTFAFTGLQPGAYRLSCSPFESQQMVQPDLERTVWVGFGNSDAHVRVTVSSGELIGKGSVHPSPGAGWGMFQILDETLHLAALGGDGAFEFSSRSPSIVGARQMQSSELQLFASRTQQGQPHVSFDIEGLQSHGLQLLSVNGRPAAFARIELELQGIQMPGACWSDEEGFLSIAADCRVDCNLMIDLGAEGRYLIPLERALAASQIRLDDPGSPREIRITDLDGNPVSTATLYLPELRVRRLSDGAGWCRLEPMSGADLLMVEKSGFWAHHSGLIGTTNVELRRTAARCTVSAREGLTLASLELIPAFTLGYEFDSDPRAVEGESHEWIIDGVPEGSYELIATDTEGQLVFDEILVLRSGTPSTVEIR